MAEIRWTNTAREEYHAILKNTYEFSMDVAIDLDDRIEALQERLLRFKKSCPPHDKIPTLRRCVVTRFVSLIYDLLGEEITIISVYDSRSAHPLN